MRAIYMPDSIPSLLRPGSGYDTARHMSHRDLPFAVTVEVFPDGETAIRVPPNITPDQHITLTGSCHDALSSETFLAAAYEIARTGPASLTVVNTYYRHARAERPVDGKAALAKFQAVQWSGLGRVSPGVRLVFWDLHKDLILHYFEGAVVTVNREARPLLETAALKLGGILSPVYATVDDGGVYDAKKLAERSGAGFAHIVKRRLSGTETKILDVIGDDVNGRPVIIFDDMISTGGSMLKAAAAYRARGATLVICAASHAIFSDNAVPAFLDALAAGTIQHILTTDTHPGHRAALAAFGDRMTVVHAG